MAPLSSRILIGALALTPLTSAWTLVWRNSTAGATIINENEPQNCTRIWHQEGEPFSWDPEGKWCMHFYKDTACTQIVGYACDGKVWRKDASRDLSAFDVYPMPPESVSVIYPSTSKSTTTSASKTSTSTAVTTTAAQTQSATSAAASTTPTETPSSSSSSTLTGGAIAGIVIGAIAAVAALAALFFFVGRRNRKPASPPDTKPDATATSPQSPQFPPGSPLGLVSTNDTAPPPAPAPAYIVPHKQELAETEMSKAQASYPHGYPRAYASSKYVELPGNGGEAELSNTRQVHEMDGTSDVKRPVYEAA
ncbi:hypothetical protein CNMCM6106_004665 [Aspergillus hiratsukae]|uniref:Uncharacterized protein n=1 Tax=Aspergillus hiratsukae TaxID=1194566 RepID=A0A8H6UKW2_9EURO|nr:hypothetical protein CNMCM6106_004665 [Aspergillus hiratsukae]